MRKPNKSRTRQCIIPFCKKKFKSRSALALYCPECSKLVARFARRQHELREEHRHSHFVACVECGNSLGAKHAHGEMYCPACKQKKLHKYIKLSRSGLLRSKVRVIAPPKPKQQQKTTEERLLPPQRKCHDCGKPTDNYRCNDCLRIWRIEHGVSVDAEEVWV